MAAHVLYGDSFLVSQALRGLEAENGAADLLEANTHRLAGAQVKPAELLSICLALPFMDSCRLVVIDGLLALSSSQTIFDAPPSEISVMPEHGVKASLIQIGQTRIEILEALDPGNPVGRFIQNKGEGLHHLALNVSGLQDKLNLLNAKGLQLIDKEPREGLSGSVAFLHPRSVFGVLTELVEND